MAAEPRERRLIASDYPQIQPVGMKTSLATAMPFPKLISDKIAVATGLSTSRVHQLLHTDEAHTDWRRCPQAGGDDGTPRVELSRFKWVA